MAMEFADLQALSRDELVQMYDRNAENVVVGLNFVREEIWRRDADAVSARMIRLTLVVTWLTGVVTAATVINLIVAILLLARA